MFKVLYLRVYLCNSLILCVNLTELKNVQIAGKTSCLCVSVRMFLEEITFELIEWVKIASEASTNHDCGIPQPPKSQANSYNKFLSLFLLCIYQWIYIFPLILFLWRTLMSTVCYYLYQQTHPVLNVGKRSSVECLRAFISGSPSHHTPLNDSEKTKLFKKIFSA